MQLRAIPILGLAVLLAAPSADAAKCPRGTLTGQVTYVRDGDTIVVGSMPIRLNGLAAPEGDEAGGAAATQAMIELVQGRTLQCELDGERTHDRCVGVCYLNGADVAEVMVREGFARDCPRFSGGRYGEAERQADADGATIRQAYILPGYCRPRRTRSGPNWTMSCRRLRAVDCDHTNRIVSIDDRPVLLIAPEARLFSWPEALDHGLADVALVAHRRVAAWSTVGAAPTAASSTTVHVVGARTGAGMARDRAPDEFLADARVGKFRLGHASCSIRLRLDDSQPVNIQAGLSGLMRRAA